MVEDTMFSGESKNIEYKVSLPDKSEKYMKMCIRDSLESEQVDEFYMHLEADGYVGDLY